jgi:hypothetical protein
MEQDHKGKARERAEAKGGAAAVEGWAAADSVSVENASAPIAVIKQLIKEARPVTR